MHSCLLLNAVLSCLVLAATGDFATQKTVMASRNAAFAQWVDNASDPDNATELLLWMTSQETATLISGKDTDSRSASRCRSKASEVQRELCMQVLRIWAELTGLNETVAALKVIHAVASKERDHLTKLKSIVSACKGEDRQSNTSTVMTAWEEVSHVLSRWPTLSWDNLLLPCLAAALLETRGWPFGKSSQHLVNAEAAVAEASRTAILEPRSPESDAVASVLHRLVVPGPSTDDPPLEVSVSPVADTDPAVFAIWNLTTESELAHLTELANDTVHSEPAAVQNNGRVDPQVRSGRVRMLGVAEGGVEDVVVSRLLERVRAVTLAAFGPEGFAQVPGERCCGDLIEATLLRYGPGDHYSWHADRAVANAKARIATVFLYLTSPDPDDNGGLTEFQNLRLAIRPKRGMAVLWHNVKPPYHQHMLHRSTATQTGTKLGMNIWISPDLDDSEKSSEL
eukprot:gnl/TRDRNA2_/TRDRNA2_144223_c2_seq1.p1 gnl/TRDRNA2_/TRDRNA2_144223_c2~~gnl/TRDRNA2_/TRDRNA2_144223_c2_seq1.p1  ORF type:complete len:454 (-),score=56.13 gnl/TRDRNA2_/TRDRNA2_144223_c2_seq1:11-1372(-)